MEEDKGGIESTSRAPAPVPDKKHVKEAPVLGKRQMFTVELRRGETTIVSWKKLFRESASGNGEASAQIANNQVPDARPVGGGYQGEDDLKHTLQPPNCFSAVIEKIERLYMGRESSDEEEHDVPDDDQYDTEDSFIDDAELDEYFQVDKLSTKHNGYFVNRGKLEWAEPSSSPNLAPKKMRRKDSKKSYEHEHEHVPNECLGNMKIKAAARNASLVAKKLPPAEVMNSFDEHYQEGKLLKTKMNSSTGIYSKRTADFVINSDIPPSAGLPNKGLSSVTIEPKEFDKRKLLSSKEHHKSGGTIDSFVATNQVSRQKAGASHAEPQSKKLFSGNNEIEALAKMQRKNKHDYVEYPNSHMASYPMQTMHLLPRAKEGTIRLKGTTIERAIRDLERVVKLSRPLDPGVQEDDSSAHGVKRRLPLEVKQKLAKVARLAASQSKISEEELLDRLMGFLGHLVQRKTLKRNMQKMVELGLSVKQQTVDKFLQIKKEVLEMINARVSHLVSKVPDYQDGLTDDFHGTASVDERRALKGKYFMDVALEDKICDLYDLHVEGMDEDKGPQSRKLYVELQELWPAGYMDTYRIKIAICNAKKRRRHKFQARHEVRIEKKTVKSEETSPRSQPEAVQGRLRTDHPVQVPAPHDKQISSLSPLFQGRVSDPTAYLCDTAQNNGYTSKHHEKASRISSGIVSDCGSKAVVDVKKRVKRKSETDAEFHSHLHKMQTQSGKEKQDSSSPSDGSNLIPQLPKPNQMPATTTSTSTSTSDQPN
ncbi:ubinuclein-1-like [Phalaenopsis equestris]|uniref:ubinuclein-1-like n=1 Tax=Phalaenopsis equestris TaxID=78828 RepID=UPI0009E3602C|nr:ubinuclein-1-like [Phalaenopsis equestris]